MLIDDITSISVNLGIVRIQGQKMNPEGILENVETIEIPAGKIGDIVNKLASGINELNEKVKEAQEAASNESNGSKSKKTTSKNKEDDDEIEIID
jgi:hypothetical protein|tara:strand:+ start:171 stop:455 length:285 start_codon:yes stop_codon:yes gene_type:complete